MSHFACRSSMRNKMLCPSVILLLLVGAVFTDASFGWENGKQYTYDVRSRTLAAFNLQSKQYTGVVIEARLLIQSSDQNTLRAKILYPKYSQVHTRLENGWDAVIPQSQLNMQNFLLSGEPFEIKTKNGVVEDLIVDRDVPIWEVNIIKSVVSQLQLDTLGQNTEKSQQNQLPEDSHPYAMFKVMEDTITGRCEVMYDISPLPQHLNNPKIVPIPKLQENGEIISIIKTKNYSNCDQRIAYHFGIDDSDKWEPGSNENGNYLFRSSVSRVIISGNLEKYTIQSSVTTNKVVQNTDLQENEQGIVVSRVNLTLHEITDATDQVPAPHNPQSTGSLVYTYNDAAGEPSSRRSSKYIKYQGHHQKYSDELGKDSNEYSDISYNADEKSYLLPKPTLMEAPLNPLFPYFIGYLGNSIQKNNKIDVVRTAKSFAQQIGNDIQKPDSMSEEQTLDKFIILCKLIRTMSAEQIAEVQRGLYQSPQSQNQLQQNPDYSPRNAWIAFRDAVANAGTGPALINVKQWIQNNQIEDYEVAKVIDTVARTARTPTSEYVDKFFEMVTMQELKKNPEIQESAVLSFTDFLRYAVVDKKSAHNRYPVHVFGKLISRDYRNVEDKYIPYLAEELKAAVNKGDSRKVLLYTVAIGKTGHPRILTVFEPYLEGKKPISLHQRLIMVFVLRPLIETHQKLVRSVLYKMYSNSADHHEIRTAAVLLLATTNPPASMLQRMAEYTNYDSNKHVNSVVKSVIQSFAEFDKSKAAALLNPEKYGFQYTHTQLMNFENLITKSRSTLRATYISSGDSVIPKVAYADYNSMFKGLKMPEFTLAICVSSVRNIFDFITQKLNPQDNHSDQKPQQQKYSPENVAKYLHINGNEPDQIEGGILLNGFYRNHVLTFDNHTIEKIYQQISKASERLRDGQNYGETLLNNYEIAISFPTETGFPFHFSFKMPTIFLFNAYTKLKKESGSDSRSSLPNYASVSGKARIVYNTGIQKRVGFVTPFEHQEYIVGIDRNLQVHLPIRSEVEYDKVKNYLKLKVQPNEDEKDFKILQYSTQPFTSKHDILSLQPIKQDDNTYIIHKDSAKSSQIEFSDPQNSKQILQFNWEKLINQGQRENKIQSAFSSLNKLMKSASYMLYPTSDDAEYQKYSVQISPPHDVSVEVKLSYDSQISSNISAGNSESKPQGKAPHLQKNFNDQERKRKLLSEASKNINSAEAEAIDISVRLNRLSTSVDVTAAVASSNIDNKSRALLHVYANIFEELDYHLAAGVESKIPNLDSFDYEENLKANVPEEYDAEIHFGSGTSENSGEDHNRIKINGKVQLTEARKNQIRQSRAAHECNKEVYQNGNKLSAPCQKVNKRAARINSGDFTVTLNKESTVDRVAMEALDIVELLTEDHAEVEKDSEEREESKKIKISFITSPNDNEVDISVKTPKGLTEFKNIRIDYGDDNIKSTQEDDDEDDIEKLFESTCSIDKSQIRSFDNHEYHLKLGQCWHAAVTTYPKNNPDNPTQKLLIPESMDLAILIKDNENNQRDLKIVLGDREIELSASGHREIQAKINGNKVHYSKEESQQERKKGEMVYEFFELSDKSVKFISSKFDIEIVYDGVRAQIKVGNRYRDSVRGLCGNNDGEWENDQQAPEGYLLQKAEEFSATYALINDNQCLGPARQYAEKAKTADRIYQHARPGNVISDKEAGRSSHDENQENLCTVQRTKVLKTENEICFSVRPVTTCSSKCKPSAMKFKGIQYHCVPRNITSEKVAQRIENGANPDLRQKAVSKTENQQIPVSCKA